MKLQKMREIVAEFVKKQTALNKDNVLVTSKGPVVEEPSNLSLKALRVEKYINRDHFGCNSNYVAELMSIVLDETIKYKGNESTQSEFCNFTDLYDQGFVPYSAMEYEDELYLHIGGHCVYDGDDEVDAYEDRYNISRAATPDEIDRMVYCLKEDEIRKYYSFLFL